MKNVENKEYHALLGLTKQERNDIIIIYETMRNKKWKVREHEEKSLCNSAGCKSGCVWTDRMREWIPEQCRAGKSKTDGLVSVRGPVKRKRRMAADDV